MHSLTVQQLVDLTEGTICGRVQLTAAIDGCVIDSRQVERGDAFFALAGARQHGASFAADAVRDGASVVILDETASADCQAPHLRVPDVEFALAQVAHHNRHLSDALVIGVTGSVGKTTTRRMISAVLQTVHTGIQSPRNFNNHLGVPLSLLELQAGDEFAVIEIGTSVPGEVRALTAIAQPEMAVVTRIAPAHLHGFGSLKAIQQEKAQLIANLSRDSVAFLNADDPLVSELSTATRARVVMFGTAASADVRATEVTCENNQVQLRVDGVNYIVPVCGRHHATSALAAIAVGREIGVPAEQIVQGLQSFRPQSGRCAVTSVGPLTVIDDTYNSSPASVTAAIRTTEEFAHCNHRVLVLGDMLDLGEQSPLLHYGIGAALASSKIDHVAVTGQFADDVIDGFLTSGGKVNRISQFDDLSLLTTMLDCLLSDDDVVLVKGSRATKMERVVKQLKSLATPDTSARRAA